MCVLNWLANWFPRIVVALYCLAPVIEFHGLLTDFETYDHLIGSDSMCASSPSHCSWEKFLIALAANTLISLVGLAILALLRGREKEFALWQWTALVFVQAAAIAATLSPDFIQ
jgi:hypothetical protein